MKYIMLAMSLSVSLIVGVESFAAGCVSGNCVNGRGTYQWDSGAEYSGDWQNQQKHGYGTYNYKGGETYTGEWRNDKKNGQGTYVWPGGYQFTGSWQSNLAHGQGIYTYPNGDRSRQVLNMGQLVSEERLAPQTSHPQPTNDTVSSPPNPPSGRRWKKAN